VSAFVGAAVRANVTQSGYMRLVWRLARDEEDVAAMYVLDRLDTHASYERTLTAYAAHVEDQTDRDAALGRALVSVTSGRGDADELRAAYAVGGWVAVRDLLEASA
jgi:hypothetical protein